MGGGGCPVTGLLRLEPESVLVLDGDEWTVRMIEAHRGRVLLRVADGQEEWRTIRWLACHRGYRHSPAQLTGEPGEKVKPPIVPDEKILKFARF
jgi:hypothetical protein